MGHLQALACAPSIAQLHNKLRKHSMEAERINQIEATLSDLSTRTQELRRYL